MAKNNWKCAFNPNTNREVWGDGVEDQLEEYNHLGLRVFGKPLSELYTICTEDDSSFDILKAFDSSKIKEQLDIEGVEGMNLYLFTISGHTVVGEVDPEIVSWIISDTPF